MLGCQYASRTPLAWLIISGIWYGKWYGCFFHLWKRSGLNHTNGKVKAETTRSILRRIVPLETTGNNDLCHASFFAKGNAPVENGADRGIEPESGIVLIVSDLFQPLFYQGWKFLFFPCALHLYDGSHGIVSNQNVRATRACLKVGDRLCLGREKYPCQ